MVIHLISMGLFWGRRDDYYSMMTTLLVGLASCCFCCRVSTMMWFDNKARRTGDKESSVEITLLCRMNRELLLLLMIEWTVTNNCGDSIWIHYPESSSSSWSSNELAQSGDQKLRPTDRHRTNSQTTPPAEALNNTAQVEIGSDRVGK